MQRKIPSIYDEYGRRYTWKQYFERVYEHSQQKSYRFPKMKMILTK